MTCALCEADNGRYDMVQTCCRVRYLLNEPRLEVRRAWLERWQTKYGSKVADEIKAEFSRMWEEQQKQKGR